MSIDKMNTIINYIKINENIHTSGQPTALQLEEVKNQGIDTIINLAAFNSEEKLENEDELVSSLQMNYFHIPVDFENPSVENLKDFISLLSSLEDKNVLVHCILNYRVSAFMYVFHKYVLKTPFDDIDLSIFEEWQPNNNWQEIMKVEL